MKWFEPSLKKILIEAGSKGLKVCDITRNICNMHPTLFGPPHPYKKTWWEIYLFLRTESTRKGSPYQYVVDEKTGKRIWGRFWYDKRKDNNPIQTILPFYK